MLKQEYTITATAVAISVHEGNNTDHERVKELQKLTYTVLQVLFWLLVEMAL